MKRKPVTADDIANQTCIWADLVKAHQRAAAVVDMFKNWFDTRTDVGGRDFDKQFAMAELNERKAWRAVARASRRLVDLSERFLATR